MEMMDTSAGRLHEILVDLRKWANAPLRQAWVRVLDVDDEDRAGLFSAISMVVELPATVQAQVLLLPDVNHDLLLRWVPAVDSAFGLAHTLEGSTGQLTGQYDDTTLYALESTTDALSRHGNALHMEPDLVTDADAKVAELLTALENLEGSEETKAMLVRHALRLQAALRMYRVSGPDGVKEALVDATAALIAARTAEDDSRPAIRKFADVVSFVADSLQIAATGAPLIALGVNEIIRQISSH
ncbi:hypothetical protein IC607_11135 [Cellulomonas sp. JH27-2]|uniref:hypothetical protein n=1 Tax=Cellulomonas sp. JH27-2 TaxID=2774139 RepID=UPI00177E62F0|nr:hypothetical protein [Cellulomonas sp. JH27-2]MBD8059519.1 hypothetical protein [Cellulomonas sp. JH27-2]